MADFEYPALVSRAAGQRCHTGVLGRKRWQDLGFAVQPILPNQNVTGSLRDPIPLNRVWPAPTSVQLSPCSNFRTGWAQAYQPFLC